MKTRFSSLIQSPDANEGMLTNSSYSTERSPVTALLFEGKRKIALPVMMPVGSLSAAETLPEAQHKVDCSFQEQ
jgi:hypothetical protein